ncbi:MAG: O-antigen ligase [Gammaproteobacteria bacterium]|jgi:O-antigen ligase
MSFVRYVPAVLIVLAVAGLANENVSHFPIGILFLLGTWQIIRNPKDILLNANAKFLLSIFACVWVPMLLSLPDAENPIRALKTTGLYVHYLPAALYISYMLRDLIVRRIVLVGIVVIVGFWCFDGIIQLLTGKDLFGYPYDGAVLKGAFYPKQRFGLVISVFAPLYLYAVSQLATRSRWAWLLLLPLFVVISFSLKRTAWIMLAAALVTYLACFFRPSRANLRFSALSSGVFLALICIALCCVPKIRTQVTDTLDIFSSDFETADIATSHRLSLWDTGFSIVRSNWLNGIGPRGFRTVYASYADPDDFWILRGKKGQTHPHLMILEVLIETGMIGLLAYCVSIFLLVSRLWRRRLDDKAATVCLIVGFVAWFPLNAHLAFYGSYWANIAWLMIAVGSTSTAVSDAASISLESKPATALSN